MRCRISKKFGRRPVRILPSRQLLLRKGVSLLWATQQGKVSGRDTFRNCGKFRQYFKGRFQIRSFGTFGNCGIPFLTPSTRFSNGPVRLICDEDEKLRPAWQYGLVGATVLLLPPRTAPLTRQSKAISGNDCVKRDLNQQALRVRRIPIRLTTNYGTATAGKSSATSHVEVRGCDGRRDSHCRSCDALQFSFGPLGTIPLGFTMRRLPK